MMKRLAAALLLLATPAMAQQVAPYTYPVTVGTTSATVITANPQRKKLIFHNPNDTAKVAVCPTGPARNTGAAMTAVINGPGCITILPYDRVEVSGGSPSGPQQAMPSAWVGIASAGASSLTILEFE